MKNKIYEYNGSSYIRKESRCQCLGCAFLDEERGDCLAPMPKEIGVDCMEIIDTRTGEHKHFQWIKISN